MSFFKKILTKIASIFYTPYTYENEYRERDILDGISSQRVAKKNSSSGKSKKAKYDQLSLPTKEMLLSQIKSNIFLLEELESMFDGKAIYVEYKRKVIVMNEDSNNSFRIIYRLRKDAPYYESTMEMINRHTRSISKNLSAYY